MVERLDFLKEQGSNREQVQLTGTSATGDCAPEPVDKHVIEQDLWTQRQGEDVFDQSAALHEIYNVEVDEQIDGKRDMTEEQTATRDEARRNVTDMFTALFEPQPKLTPNPQNEKLAGFMGTLMDTEDFHQLRQKTMYDSQLSGMVTRILSEQWVSIIDREEPTGPGPGTIPGDNPGGDGGIGQDELDNLKDAAEALDKANEEINDFQDCQRTLGGIGSSTGSMSLDEVEKVFLKIKQSDHLMEIMKRAGAYRLEAMGMQEQKIVHGSEEVVGVVNSGDIGRLLPTEIFRLGDDDLGDEATRRLLEGQCQSLELEGTELFGQGSIVVVVDESGSMNGEPIWNSKAIALGLYWIARTQRRWICLVGFAGGTSGTFLVIPPGESKDVELLDWLEHFFNGGTSCDVPLEVLPAKWNSLGMPSTGSADMICITDDYIDVPKHVEDEFNQWKADNNVKLQTLVLSQRGHRNSRGGKESMAKVSDLVHHIDNLSVEQEAVKTVLSL